MAAQLPLRFRGSGARQGRGLLAFQPDMTAFRVPPLVTSPGTVTLPTWPTTYTGPTYYVSASGGATSLTGNSRSSPATAQTALDNAASLSTIVFLGAGPYSAINVNRTTSTHLKLIADVPCFTDLQNLRPTAMMTAAQMDALADSVVVGANLSTSCRLRQLLVRSGGNIWVEGFRVEYPDIWSVSDAANGSAGTVARFWLEKVRMWQGDGLNLRIGLQTASSPNALNVVHKFWCISENEIGDPKPGGGTWDSTAGAGDGDTTTAICDYGVQAYQGTGSIQVLESFFQMRANHMISWKRGVGENTPAVRNRIEGNLFASWNRSDYGRNSTCLELGQEADDDGNDYTSRATDVLNNTFVDPNCRVLYLKNQAEVVFDGNRVILCNNFMFTGIDSGTAPSEVNGPTVTGDWTISNNIIMDSGPGTAQLYSGGNALTVTFTANDTVNLIPITTHATVLNPSRFPNASFPRPTVVRTGGNASGFAAETNA